MESAESVKSFVTFITSVGGTAVGASVAWAVAKRKLLLPREVEQLTARITELIQERDGERAEHAREVTEFKQQIDRLMGMVLRSVNNNERLQQTNERAVGVVAQVVQAGTSEAKP